MDKMEKLWEYMEEDIKADRIEMEIKRSPLRQKLEKTRDFIMSQQKIYKDMEERVAISADRKDAIRDALKRSEEQLVQLQARFEEHAPETLEEASAFLSDVDRCRKTIVSYEQELKKLHKEGTDLDGKGRAIRHDTAVAKQDFDRIKGVYNQESKEKKAQLEAQRSAADAKLAGVDPDLLAVYSTVKKHISPPMARLVNNQCSGCNTSQPSAALRKIDLGNDIVECETCGRILIK